jgi:ferredoxin
MCIKFHTSRLVANLHSLWCHRTDAAVPARRQHVKVGQKAVLDAGRLDSLFEALRAQRYTIVGPTLRDMTIACDELRSVDDLPRGWTDDQEAGRYRLRKGEEARALFAYTLGPQAWKRYLHPPLVTLWRAERSGAGVRLGGGEAEAPRQALLGVRACEIQAIAVQDQVFLHGPAVDPTYRTRRAKTFVVAVQCGRAGATCFCASMGTGPRLASGFDLGLVEILEPERHAFLLEVGSAAGAAVAEALPLEEAKADDLGAFDAAAERARAGMGRALEAQGVRELLLRHAQDASWDRVGERCLACGNCTMVCPTCFCTTVEDVTDLTGERAERRRRWDSCFGLEFSSLHGAAVRRSVGARYRHWITHKLATWHDQFNSSGCVGCGRCITWCPVGIDITREVAALRATEGPGGSTR